MRPLKVAAADDERGVLLLLKSILSEMDGIQLAGAAENAAAANELVNKQKPDLVPASSGGKAPPSQRYRVPPDFCRIPANGIL